MNTNTEPLRTIDGAALMSLPLRPPNLVVDTLLSQGLHILAGSPNVGKSWLALWLAVTEAKGEPVWNLPVNRGTTLYLCPEDSTRAHSGRKTLRKEREKKIAHGHKEDDHVEEPAWQQTM